MLVGIIGAPNKGKSTIFSAVTLAQAEIANYPFTTIKPNLGVGYATKPCVETQLHTKCKPRNSLCSNGIRRIPANVIDVAGLVPGAHLGKGMGNQFLNDLISAEVLIQVVDVTGKTDVNGNACDYSDPSQEVKMIKDELASWLADIITRHIGGMGRRSDGDKALMEVLSGFKTSIEQIRAAAEKHALSLGGITWGKDDTYAFASSLLELNKPMVVAANKMDLAKAGALEDMAKKLPGTNVVGCSGAIELALRKAAKSGAIDYEPGASDFKVLGSVSGEQKDALDFMASYIRKSKGTGVQELMNAAVFGVLNNIAVYPVEDENKYTDHFGNVLPDVLLIREGASARDLAAMIHTDLAEHMLYAVDAKKKMRLAKDYKLKDDDVVKIVSAAK